MFQLSPVMLHLKDKYNTSAHAQAVAYKMNNDGITEAHHHQCLAT